MKQKRLKSQLINKAWNFFLKNTDNIDIQEIKLIHTGLTNNSFYIKSNNKEYIVRLASNYESIDRKLEKQILFKSSNIFYLDEDGNYIKEYIKGRNLKKDDVNDSLIESLIEEINEFQKLNIETKNKFDYHRYLDKLDNSNMKDKYLELLNSYTKEKFVLSHCDINCDNILIHNNKLTLIDYEWSRLNYKWFDINYFLIHATSNPSNLIKKHSKYVSLDKLFVVSYFCLSWINNVHNNNTKFKKLKSKYKKYSKFLFNELNKTISN